METEESLGQSHMFRNGKTAVVPSWLVPNTLFNYLVSLKHVFFFFFSLKEEQRRTKVIRTKYVRFVFVCKHWHLRSTQSVKPTCTMWKIV